MDAKEQLVRAFYDARARRDWVAARAMLAEDVAWHELGPKQDYSGDHRGREQVAALLEKLVAVTEGTFSLEPIGFVATAEHIAASVRRSATREGKRSEGNDLAVFRIANRKIAEAWLFPDGFELQAVSEVFSFTSSP